MLRIQNAIVAPRCCIEARRLQCELRAWAMRMVMAPGMLVRLVRSSLVQEVQGIVWAIHLLAHDGAGLVVFQWCVGLIAAPKLGSAAPSRRAGDAAPRVARGVAGAGTAQGLVAADAATGGQGLVAVDAAVDGWRGAGVGVGPLAAVADDVGILVADGGGGGVVVVGVVVVLALAAGRAKVALLGLSAAAHARRLVWVVDAAEVAPDLAAAAGDAGLVDTLVLLGDRRGGRRGGGCGWGRRRRGGVGVCASVGRCSLGLSLRLRLRLSHGAWQRA